MPDPVLLPHYYASEAWYISPPCPEGCKSEERFCHCQSCGTTGVPVNDDGYCLPCKEKIADEIPF